ncbi:zinc ribbon domain-containing protein [Kitasatospora sp. NPDC058965]|uniref:zinc ribbon domain-containing protein n=1 Tax=Kitasatospora sp. NPDC058965 TaxID=3346682 RepID=UPI0036CE6937
MSASQTPTPKERECTECGAPVESGRKFCDACGAFLSWAGEEPAAAQPPAEPATGPAAEPAPPAEPAAPAPAAEAAAAAVPTKDPDTAEIPVVEVLRTERAHALLVPVPEHVEQPAGAAAAVLPGRPQESGPRVRAVVDEQVLDGITCRWCDTVNPHERHFCRRCAAAFAEPEAAAARRPWWRRLLDFRGREAPWAGQRPRLRRGPWALVRRVLVVVVVVAVLVAVVVWSGPATEAVTDHFAKRVPVDPVTMTASHSYDGHGPELTIDKISNSWWGNGYGGDPQNTWLEAAFAQPEHLLNVLITPGVSAEPDKQLAEARPHAVDLVATTADGRTSTTHLELAADGAQSFDLRLDKVVKVRLNILSAYGTGPDKQVAVAEVEFFGTKPGGN